MTARIEKHVSQRMPHLARRAEDVEVKTICQHAARSPEHAIHRPGQARGNGFHPASKLSLACCLDQQVNVIALNRIVNQPEAPAVARRSEAAFLLANELHASQRRQPAPHLQRDVTRKARRERTPRAMRMSRARAALAARTRASSTPARALAKSELQLPNPTSH